MNEAVWVAVGIVLGVFGAIPTLILLRERFSGVRDMRRLLDLGPHERVEILVTTSATDISRVGPADRSNRARRSLVPSGDLAGVADLSVMLARAYPRKTFVVTPSSRVPIDLEADNFIVGGPIHNAYAAQLVSSMPQNDTNSGLDVVFDASRRYIKFGRHTFGPGIDLEFDDHVPRVDYGVILLTRVSRGSRGTRTATRRVLVAAGLTTYGTHAAASFAAYQLTDYAKQHGFGKAPNVYVLVRARFVNGEPYDVQPIDAILEAPPDPAAAEA